MRGKSVPDAKGELRVMVSQGRRIWGLLSHRHRASLGAAVALMAVVGAATAAIPVILGRLVDEVVARRVATFAGVIPFLAALAATYLVKEAIQVGRKIVVENACTSLEKEATVMLVRRLLMADLETIGNRRLGELHGRIQRSIQGLERAVKLMFLDLLPVSFVGLFSLGVAVAQQPLLGVIMGLVIPIGTYIVMRQLRSEKGVRLDLLRLREAMDGAMVEQLGGLDYIRAAGTHAHEVDRIERHAESLRRQGIRHHTAMALYDCGKALNEGGFHVVVIGSAIAMAMIGRISTGEILTFSVLFMGVMNPLREVHRILDEGHESSLCVVDLLSMLAEPVDASFSDGPGEEPCLASEHVPVIEARDLMVEYGRDSRRVRVLEGMSFAMRRGSTLGIAGPSGSGKSTMLRAVLRLTHPVGGQLLVGGVPIGMVTREAIGRLVGFVSQTPFLFSGTIAENIAYGSPGASTAEIRHAASLARIDDEIEAMEEGYGARVSERGQNLSGGQRQRLALARIFLRNPPILILDEATAALDNINERAVLEALRAVRAGRSVIIVAHRLSTLRDADQILVFEAGRIVERGTFDDLLQAGGLFARMARSAEAHREAAGVPDEEAAARGAEMGDGLRPVPESGVGPSVEVNRAA